MLNLEEDKRVLRVLAADTIDDLIRTNSEDVIDYFKLSKGKNDPTVFCP